MLSKISEMIWNVLPLNYYTIVNPNNSNGHKICEGFKHFHMNKTNKILFMLIMIAHNEILNGSSC